MVVIVHVDDIFAHAKDQAAIIARGLPLSLEESNLKDTGNDNNYTGVPTLSKEDEPQTPEETEDISKFPYREAVGAFMWTVTMTFPDIACAVYAEARL